MALHHRPALEAARASAKRKQRRHLAAGGPVLPSRYPTDALGFNPMQYQPAASLPAVTAGAAQAPDPTASLAALSVLKAVGPTVAKQALGLNGNSGGLNLGIGDGIDRVLFGTPATTTVASPSELANLASISPDNVEAVAAQPGLLGTSDNVLGTGASVGQIGTGLGGLGGIAGGIMGLTNAGNQNGIGIAGDVAQLGGGAAALGSTLGLVGAAGGPIGLAVAGIGALASSLFGNKHPEHPTGQAMSTLDSSGNFGDWSSFTTDKGNSDGPKQLTQQLLAAPLQQLAKQYDLTGQQIGILNNAGTYSLSYDSPGNDPYHGEQPATLFGFDPNNPASVQSAFSAMAGEIAKNAKPLAPAQSPAGQASSSQPPAQKQAARLVTADDIKALYAPAQPSAGSSDGLVGADDIRTLYGRAGGGMVDAHATNADISAFDKSLLGRSGTLASREGFFLAFDPDTASYFARTASNTATGRPDQGANVLPPLHRSQNPGHATLTSQDLNPEIAATLNVAFHDLGHDAVRLRNDITPESENRSDSLVVKEPNQLRSRFAAFDPAKRDSADLLAGVLPLIFAGTASGEGEAGGGSDSEGNDGGEAHGGRIGDERVFSGVLQGPGTPTSDSIPTKLPDGAKGPLVSRDEFVVNARTVRKVGPQFLYGLQQLADQKPSITPDDIRVLYQETAMGFPLSTDPRSRVLTARMPSVARSGMAPAPNPLPLQLAPGRLPMPMRSAVAMQPCPHPPTNLAARVAMPPQPGGIGPAEIAALYQKAMGPLPLPRRGLAQGGLAGLGADPTSDLVRAELTGAPIGVINDEAKQAGFGIGADGSATPPPNSGGSATTSGMAAPQGFDARYYLQANPDVKAAATAAGGDPNAFALNHWENYGYQEDRPFNAAEAAAVQNFDPTAYLQANPDVLAAVNKGQFGGGGDNGALQHFVDYGFAEGRSPTPANGAGITPTGGVGTHPGGTGATNGTSGTTTTQPTPLSMSDVTQAVADQLKAFFGQSGTVPNVQLTGVAPGATTQGPAQAAATVLSNLSPNRTNRFASEYMAPSFFG